MARTVADEKKTLRAILSESRDALSIESAAALSEIIQRRVIESEFYRAASAVVLYASKGNEVSTDIILADSLSAGRAVFYPRVDAERGTIVARRVRSSAELQSGAYDILGPSDSKVSALAVAGAIMIVSSRNLAMTRSAWDSPIRSSCSIEFRKRDSIGGS